jgi:isoleucyl-tRNA synthetase
VIVVHGNEEFLEEVRALESYILEELNVRKLTLSSNKAAYEVHLKAQPNHQLLGAKHKTMFKQIATAIKVRVESRQSKN